MDRQQDLKINRQIRAALVRHWIDLGKLSIRSVMGKVKLHGSLNRIYGKKEDLTPAVVETMFLDIKRIRGVHSVIADVDNWTDAGGKWQPLNKEGKRSARSESSGAGNKFNISDKTGDNLADGVTEL